VLQDPVADDEMPVGVAVLQELVAERQHEHVEHRADEDGEERIEARAAGFHGHRDHQVSLRNGESGGA
jgi:hypothetical protein